MVDVARYFLSFTQDESCGKCTPCREGTKRLLEILTRITHGKGEPGDLRKLERLSHTVRRSSLCGLGQSAPNPILSTLRFFKDEYEAHINEKRCPAHSCPALLRYCIDPEKCVGCTLCARICPVNCISGEPKKIYVIDQLRCIRCGECMTKCRFDAIYKE
jgi:ferredoxin